jgi:hypothetical protein
MVHRAQELGMPAIGLTDHGALYGAINFYEAAHKAGVKIAAVPSTQMEIVTTGGPEVVVKGKQGPLYQPTGNGLEKIKGDEMQMCAGMALMAVYPPRLVAVRTPNGNWEVVN